MRHCAFISALFLTLTTLLVTACSAPTLAPKTPKVHATTPVSVALDRLAEGDTAGARAALVGGRPGTLAPVLLDLLKAHEQGSGAIAMTAMDLAGAVPAEEFDAALDRIGDLFATRTLTADSRLRELWCHLGNLHPAGADPREIREAARHVDDDRPTDLTLPVKRTALAPSYPASARRDRLTGSVTYRATIDHSGCIVAMEPIWSLREDLDQAAYDAIRWWTFEPARNADGEAVPVSYDLTVNFELSEGGRPPSPRMDRKTN